MRKHLALEGPDLYGLPAFRSFQFGTKTKLKREAASSLESVTATKQISLAL